MPIRLVKQKRLTKYFQKQTNKWSTKFQFLLHRVPSPFPTQIGRDPKHEPNRVAKKALGGKQAIISAIANN